MGSIRYASAWKTAPCKTFNSFLIHLIVNIWKYPGVKITICAKKSILLRYFVSGTSTRRAWISREIIDLTTTTFLLPKWRSVLLFRREILHDFAHICLLVHAYLYRYTGMIYLILFKITGGVTSSYRFFHQWYGTLLAGSRSDAQNLKRGKFLKAVFFTEVEKWGTT